jgi:large subunit ribosomal protein L22
MTEKTMQVKAKARFIHMSPKKVRLVLDVIKGMNVEEAKNQLKFIPKQACQPILKLLNSAIANAKENYNLEKENLYIKEIRADQGPTLKRWMPRARGQAMPIRKRSSHISIVLDQGEKSKKIEKKKKEKIEKPQEIKGILKKETIEKIKFQEKIKETGEHKSEPEDVRREAGRRWKEHLDKLRLKGAGGVVKRIFRRKAG